MALFWELPALPRVYMERRVGTWKRGKLPAVWTNANLLNLLLFQNLIELEFMAIKSPERQIILITNMMPQNQLKKITYYKYNFVWCLLQESREPHFGGESPNLVYHFISTFTWYNIQIEVIIYVSPNCYFTINNNNNSVRNTIVKET